MLEIVGDIAAKEIAPRAAEVDREGAHFEDGEVSYAQGHSESPRRSCAKADLMGITLPRRYGGLNFPGLLYSMAIEMVAQADASLMNIFGLQDIAETINKFGDDELKDQVPAALRQRRGHRRDGPHRARGRLRPAIVQLKAVPQADGTWRLIGVKRFITNGCGEVSLVLARSEEGSVDGRGLSMFLCESHELVIRRIEDKLGIHGSPTCELQFNDAPALLVGERRLGLIRYVMA